MPRAGNSSRNALLLKVAALGGAFLIAVGAQASAEQLLSGADIESQIVGHSFQGRKGILRVNLHYGQDGTVTMQSPIGTGKGTWSLSENRLCVTLVTGPRKGRECLTFTALSGKEYRASNGVRLTLRE